MSTKTTPEERAEKRLERLDKETAQISIDKYDSFATRGAYRNGFATCIREEVEPLEAEVAKLRALVQGLKTAGDVMYDELRANDSGNGSSERARMDMYRSWDAAKSQGFTRSDWIPYRRP